MLTLTDCILYSGHSCTGHSPSANFHKGQEKFHSKTPRHETSETTLRMGIGVPIDAPDGAVGLLQVYCPNSMTNVQYQLEGDPAFRLGSCVFTSSFIFLEVQFTPRESVQYTTHCVIKDESGTFIRILITAVGCDPRNQNISNIPSSIVHPPNSLSRCDFNQGFIAVASHRLTHTYKNFLSNQESRFPVHFRLGPVHPALTISPLEGDVEPGASVEIAISLKLSEKLLIGSLFVPCLLSLGQRESAEKASKQSPRFAGDDGLIEFHSCARVIQSVSRLICNKGITGHRSVCERSTRSRTSKLSLEARMKLFDQKNTENSHLPDHYIGFHIVCQPHS